jgi:uncharacterized Zn finger protein
MWLWRHSWRWGADSRLSQLQEEVGMTCRRCCGLLVHDRSELIYRYDLSEVTGYTGTMLRCINCGYVEDPVVRANRLRPIVADD